jgi:hypothetical protein
METQDTEADKLNQMQLVKVYRAAFEEGKRKGVSDMINAAGMLTSGITDLKSIIEDSYKSTPVVNLIDNPSSFELEKINKILKE